MIDVILAILVLALIWFTVSALRRIADNFLDMVNAESFTEMLKIWWRALRNKKA